MLAIFFRLLYNPEKVVPQKMVEFLFFCEILKEKLTGKEEVVW